MNALDAIKARAEAADFADLDTELLRQSSTDVPRLVAAIEAVLELVDKYVEPEDTTDSIHSHWYDTPADYGRALALLDVRAAIHRALEGDN